MLRTCEVHGTVMELGGGNWENAWKVVLVLDYVKQRNKIALKNEILKLKNRRSLLSNKKREKLYCIFSVVMGKGLREGLSRDSCRTYRLGLGPCWEFKEVFTIWFYFLFFSSALKVYHPCKLKPYYFMWLLHLPIEKKIPTLFPFLFYQFAISKEEKKNTPMGNRELRKYQTNPLGQ